MNKLILLSIICVLCAYIGIAIKKIYKVRCRYLADYVTFLDELIEEVSYAKEPFINFIDRICEYKCKEFRKDLCNLKASISLNKEYMISTICLRRKDKEIIQNCYTSIGRTDASTQIINLNNAKIQANNMLNIANKEYKTKGELYGRLGFLLGIAISILMI